jgi:hypothetical protein
MGRWAPGEDDRQGCARRDQARQIRECVGEDCNDGFDEFPLGASKSFRDVDQTGVRAVHGAKQTSEIVEEPFFDSHSKCIGFESRPTIVSEISI